MASRRPIRSRSPITSSAPGSNPTRVFSDMPSILCAGIAVLDEVFRVSAFPLPDTNVQASEFITIGGGNAAIAAVAISRLGCKAHYAAPPRDAAVRGGRIASLQ